uniref:Uncharacterized protein n=1 Tax=Glossina brevipalpis TaxID=37001 RepID=A0A1A9WGC8_9MUSC
MTFYNTLHVVNELVEKFDVTNNKKGSYIHIHETNKKSHKYVVIKQYHIGLAAILSGTIEPILLTANTLTIEQKWIRDEMMQTSNYGNEAILFLKGELNFWGTTNISDKDCNKKVIL